jgi:hypothetical protein
MKLTQTWKSLVTSPYKKRAWALSSTVVPKEYTDEQIDLLKYLVESGVAGSKNKVKEFLGGYLRIGAFEKTKCKLPIDWQANPFENRTWQWLHHQLAILGDFTCLLINDNYDFLIESPCLIIDDWIEGNFTINLPSEFSWGDHSTAHRLKNLTHFLLVSGSLLPPNKFEKYLDIVDIHCRILASSKFYNKHTNHGLDQVLYLLIAGCYFPQLRSSKRYIKIAMQRLEGEITYGFAKDGVHVENSPQYHFILLNRLAILNSLIDCFDIKSNINLKELFKKAITFARFIKRPDDLIPIIGDSEQKKAFVSPLFNAMKEYENFYNDQTLNKVESHIFEDSGYYTYRQQLTAEKVDDLHMVVKCGHLSDYHRQDDDGSFVLMAYGEDWIVDGGLYMHNHKDITRVYMRSNRAHNSCIINNVTPIRSKNKLPKSPSLKLTKKKNKETLKSVTHMYPGFILDRCINVENNIISIQDCVKKSESNKNSTELEKSIFFHVPTDKHIEISDDKIILSSKNSGIKLEIKVNSLGGFEVLKQENTSENRQVYSKIVGKLEDVTTFEVRFLQPYAKSKFDISFEHTDTLRTTNISDC